jgi:hypothetical protein
LNTTIESSEKENISPKRASAESLSPAKSSSEIEDDNYEWTEEELREYDSNWDTSLYWKGFGYY